MLPHLSEHIHSCSSQICIIYFPCFTFYVLDVPPFSPQRFHCLLMPFCDNSVLFPKGAVIIVWFLYKEVTIFNQFTIWSEIPAIKLYLYYLSDSWVCFLCPLLSMSMFFYNSVTLNHKDQYWHNVSDVLKSCCSLQTSHWTVVKRGESKVVK